VFDGGDGAALGFAHNRAEFRRRDGQMARIDQAIAPAGKAGAEKNNAMIGLGRMKDDLDVSP
jgi:hypothetical protein